MNTPLWVTVVIGLFAAFGVLSAERSRRLAKESLGISKANRNDIEARQKVTMRASARWRPTLPSRPTDRGTFDVFIDIFNSGRTIRITGIRGYNKSRDEWTGLPWNWREYHRDIEPDGSASFEWAWHSFFWVSQKSEDNIRAPIEGLMRIDVVGVSEPLVIPIENLEELVQAYEKWIADDRAAKKRLEEPETGETDETGEASKPASPTPATSPDRPASPAPGDPPPSSP